MVTTLFLLESLAATATLLGAWLVGSRTMRARKMGFFALLASSLLWSSLATTLPFFLMQLSFIVTSLYGLCNNWAWRHKDQPL